MFAHIIEYYNLILLTSKDATTRMIAFDAIMEYQALRWTMLAQSYVNRTVRG